MHICPLPRCFCANRRGGGDGESVLEFLVFQFVILDFIEILFFELIVLAFVLIVVILLSWIESRAQQQATNV